MPGERFKMGASGTAGCGEEGLAEFLRLLGDLPPEDQRFLKRLIVELARRDWPDDGVPAKARILEVAREIAPHRVGWLLRRLTF